MAERRGINQQSRNVFVREEEKKILESVKEWGAEFAVVTAIRVDKCGANGRQEEESLGRVCTSIICFVGTAVPRKTSLSKTSVYLEGSHARAFLLI